LVLCPLARITSVITDEKVSDKAASMLEAADVNLIIAQSRADQIEEEAAS
jgi:DeoR family ulaG and ulaABCDEF operon transcriptional repressor